MEAIPSMLYAVFKPACCVYADRVYVFGGFLYDCRPLLALQVYSLSHRSWSEFKLESLRTDVFLADMACHFVCHVDHNLYVVMGHSQPLRTKPTSCATRELPVASVHCIAKFCPRMLLFTEVCGSASMCSTLNPPSYMTLRSSPLCNISVHHFQHYISSHFFNFSVFLNGI